MVSRVTLVVPSPRILRVPKYSRISLVYSRIKITLVELAIRKSKILPYPRIAMVKPTNP